MSMIKLSNGVELSEDTVVAALKKAGIETNPPKPKHIFEAGDVAYYKGIPRPFNWRLIIIVNDKLKSVDRTGYVYNFSEDSQEHFERYGYEFIGKLEDLLK